jgi:hypothetical protein
LSIITENQLDEWVRCYATIAQGVIVDLVKKLITSTIVTPKEIRFPLSDSIGQHGPDGFLNTDFGFNPYIPIGKSYWEIGTGVNAKKKAESDYSSLTHTTPPEERCDSTIIIVTPLSGRRDWEYTWKEEGQKNWLENKKALKEWKDVKIIDGTTLIDWLHQSPAVELWLASKLCADSNLYFTIPEIHWDLLKTYGEPPQLKPLLFLANRDLARNRLNELFSGSLKQLRLETYFPEQIVDFVTAEIINLDDKTKEAITSRCLIISDRNTWVKITKYYKNLILIANFDIDKSDSDSSGLLQQAKISNNSVIFSSIPGGSSNLNSVVLAKPTTNQVRESLEKCEYLAERARSIATKCNGNLSILKRLLQDLSWLPEWAQSTDASNLAVSECLGSWQNDNEEDKNEIEKLSGKEYGEWIGSIRLASMNPNTPLTNRDGKWKFISRYEGWFALGSRISDDFLDKFKVMALSVLSEIDPKFDLLPEDQFASNIYGKNLKFSHSLRKGLSETLSLLGSYPAALTSISIGKAEIIANFIVKNILSSSDWRLWASLSAYLPLFAEASPNEFLVAVENAIDNQTNLFEKIFSQETTNNNYMTGLLWALESLAWSPDYFIRVIALLGRLALKDPGGNWANRPINSLTTILLPWFPQTTAKIEKRIIAVDILLKESPKIAWDLILSMLRSPDQITTGSYKPNWREWIPDDWENGSTRQDYQEQILAYESLALKEAKKDVTKLVELIDRLNELSPPSQEELINYLSLDTLLSLSDSERFCLWNALTDLTVQHKKYTEVDWVMKEEMIEKVIVVANKLKPTNFYQYQRLFIENDFELLEETDNYDEQYKILQNKRQKAIQEIYNNGGLDGLINFIRDIESSWSVGYLLGFSIDADVDHSILPTMLESNDKAFIQFVGGFIKGKLQKFGWDWVDGINLSEWTKQQIGLFFAYLPFIKENWTRVSKNLKDEISLYWTKTNITPHDSNGDLEEAIDFLLLFNRPFEAIYCLNYLSLKKLPIKVDQAIRSLLSILKKPEMMKSMNMHIIINLIKTLQENPEIELKALIGIEWSFLPVLSRFHGGYPKTLEKQLAVDPDFFCEILRIVYQSKGNDQDTIELSEENKNIALNGFRLFNGWKYPPGKKDDGSFDGDFLYLWFQKVKTICSENCQLDPAYSRIGHVLFYTPPDPDGLWIHHSTAELLDASDGNHLRDGFTNQLINSRGVYWVSGGKEEKELAEKYKKQAEDLENKGYLRFANAMRSVASFYLKEAAREEKRSEEE